MQNAYIRNCGSEAALRRSDTLDDLHSPQPDQFKVISIRRIELQTESLSIFQGKPVQFDIGCLCPHSPAVPLYACATASLRANVQLYRLGTRVERTFIQ